MTVFSHSLLICNLHNRDVAHQNSNFLNPHLIVKWKKGRSSSLIRHLESTLLWREILPKKNLVLEGAPSFTLRLL